MLSDATIDNQSAQAHRRSPRPHPGRDAASVGAPIQAAGMIEPLSALRDWIVTRHPDKLTPDFDLDTELIETRLIDSLDFAEFLFVLEEVSGRLIDLETVDLQTFRSLRTIQAHFLQG
jgi:acyl carrier protein